MNHTCTLLKNNPHERLVLQASTQCDWPSSAMDARYCQ
jgi:hypothetical protein